MFCLGFRSTILFPAFAVSEGVPICVGMTMVEGGWREEIRIKNSEC
jgi:hypothetical protein